MWHPHHPLRITLRILALFALAGGVLLLWLPVRQNAQAEMHELSARASDALREREMAEKRLLENAQAPLPPPPPPALAFATDTAPSVGAIAVAVTDIETGEDLYIKNADKKRAIASISKLITAVTARAHGSDEESVLAPSGSHYTLGALLRPLFLKSDNAVAESIARHFGERKFIAMMNALVADIGMKDTSFEDPSGISPHNISTAHDLTLLARYIAEKDRPVFGVSREKTADIVSSEGEHWKMQNQNVLARDDPRFLGGKLGFTTEAKRTALTVFSLSVRGEKRPVVIVVLGTDDWRKDTLALAEWVEKHP